MTPSVTLSTRRHRSTQSFWKLFKQSFHLSGSGCTCGSTQSKYDRHACRWFLKSEANPSKLAAPEMAQTSDHILPSIQPPALPSGAGLASSTADVVLPEMRNRHSVASISFEPSKILTVNRKENRSLSFSKSDLRETRRLSWDHDHFKLKFNTLSQRRQTLT